MTYRALSGKRLKVFSPKSETGIVCRKIEQENQIRIIQIAKGDAKSSLFTGFIIIYT